MYLCFSKIVMSLSFFICQINYTSTFIFEENIQLKSIFCIFIINIYMCVYIYIYIYIYLCELY